MATVRLKFQWSTLWLLAAVVVCAVEIYAASGRGFSGTTSVWNDDLQSADQVAIPNRATASISIGTIGDSTRSTGSAILVLGNLSAVFDGDLEVTLTAKPVYNAEIPSVRLSEAGRVATNARSRGADAQDTEGAYAAPLRRASSLSLNSRCTTEQPGTSRSPSQPAVCQDSRRVYFLQTAISSLGNKSAHSAVACSLIAENRRIRIYVDERLPRDESLANLVNAIDEASLSRLGDVVEELMGPVCDVDQDGHLAVVLTPEVARLGRGQTAVDGLTRPADFLVGLDRPQGNNSDIIFLSSSLRSGEQLRAVLAHEWCHAAVFGRRLHGTETRTSHPTEDDWLNEAIAHVVEVRASGSMSNLSHRIDSYLSHPGDSLLVVRDYCQPNYWRHDGCRGAAYLFLQWCLDQTDESLLNRFVDGRSSGLDNLEAATGRSFEELFLGWTTSLGLGLANADNPNSPNDDGVRAATIGLSHRHWRLNRSGEQMLTVRIRGTCAEFIRIECGEGDNVWQLTAATASRGDRLQTTLIPVANCQR